MTKVGIQETLGLALAISAGAWYSLEKFWLGFAIITLKTASFMPVMLYWAGRCLYSADVESSSLSYGILKIRQILSNRGEYGWSRQTVDLDSVMGRSGFKSLRLH